MKSGFFCFTVGLLVTLGGVGGIEASADDSALISAVIVSAVGLLVMWVGTIQIKRAEIG
jgi:hypothetical protein